MTRSSVEPSTNSPGWRMNGSASSISTSSVEVLHRLLDVDVRVARVAEDAEVAVDAHVDARRLHETVVERVDSDPPVGDAGGGSSGRTGPSGQSISSIAKMVRTRTISLRTATPGPALARDPRAQGAGRRRAALDLPCRSWSRRRTGPRSPTSTATSFVDFTGGVGCLNVGHTPAPASSRRRPSNSRASRTRTSPSCRTRATSQLAERLVGLVPISGPVAGGVLQLGRGGDRERRQDRPRRTRGDRR